MAGTIFISDTRRWSAASWLFDFVLASAAELDAVPVPLQVQFREIVAENIGAFDFRTLEEDTRRVALAALAAQLLETVKQSLSKEIVDREGVVAQTAELVELIRISS